MITPIWGRYADLRPDDLAAIRATHPIVYLPWGALEWHGPHLPLGTNGMIAETVAELAVQRTGGVLLPTTWWSSSVLFKRHTIAVRNTLLQELWRDLISRVAEEGWRVVVIISGNYGQEQDLTLMEMAEWAMEQHEVLVLALPPLALIDESLLDHGALWETSLLLALRPMLVDVYALGDGELGPESSAVQGRDPRGAASASLGDTVLHLAVDRIVKAVCELVENDDPAPLYAFYEERRERYKRIQ